MYVQCVYIYIYIIYALYISVCVITSIHPSNQPSKPALPEAGTCWNSQFVVKQRVLAEIQPTRHPTSPASPITIDFGGRRGT